MGENKYPIILKPITLLIILTEHTFLYDSNRNFTPTLFSRGLTSGRLYTLRCLRRGGNRPFCYCHGFRPFRCGISSRTCSLHPLHFRCAALPTALGGCLPRCRHPAQPLPPRTFARLPATRLCGTSPHANILRFRPRTHALRSCVQLLHGFPGRRLRALCAAPKGAAP